MTESRTTPTLCVLVIATGPVEKAGFLDPGGAGHLAIAVEAEPSGINGIGILLAAGQDDRDAGADRTLADFELAISANERGRADFHSGYIGDRVERCREFRRKGRQDREREQEFGVTP